MLDTSLVLWLFVVPTAALVFASIRTLRRIARGKESGSLKLSQPEVAAGVAALGAAVGIVW
jgi:hypothetical protein